jgi:hypothetical protein
VELILVCAAVFDSTLATHATEGVSRAIEAVSTKTVAEPEDETVIAAATAVFAVTVEIPELIVALMRACAAVVQTTTADPLGAAPLRGTRAAVTAFAVEVPLDCGLVLTRDAVSATTEAEHKQTGMFSFASTAVPAALKQAPETEAG